LINSIDPFLNRMPKADYNCLDFSREVWLAMFGEDIKERLDKLCAGIRGRDGRVVLSGVKGFTKLERPESPCFIVMQRNKTQPHIGLFYNGRILHLADEGVEFQPLTVARRYFTRIGYYK
jgi:hypothetical protein